jgi:hypothetical protein
MIDFMIDFMIDLRQRIIPKLSRRWAYFCPCGLLNDDLTH